VGFNISQLLIRFSAIIRYWRKKMGVQWDSTSTIQRLQGSLWFSEEGSIVKYIYFRVPMKFVRLIQMCLNDAYSKIHICRHLSDSLPIQNALK
jgi:hypothetical protein